MIKGINRILGTFAVLVCLTIILLGIYSFKPVIVNREYPMPKNLVDNNSSYVLNNQLELYKKDLQEDYNNHINNLNTRFNMLMTIFGIAITAWVGLNIYSYIDKFEFNDIKNEAESLRNEINNLKEREETLREAISELEKKPGKFG